MPVQKIKKYLTFSFADQELKLFIVVIKYDSTGMCLIQFEKLM